MQNNVTELTQRLLRSLDSNYNVINMPEVLDIISCLEKVAVTKELLETTRLGKHVNDLRRKTTNEQLAKRAKGLLKTWRSQVLPENNGQIKTSPPLQQSPVKGSPSPGSKVSPPQRLVSPGLVSQRLVSPSLSQRLASPKGIPQRLVSPNVQRLASSGVSQKLVSPKIPQQRLVSPKIPPQALVSPKAPPQRLVSPKVPVQRLVSPSQGGQSTSQNLGVISPPLATNADVNLTQLKGTKRAAQDHLDNINIKRARFNGITDLDLSDNSNCSIKDVIPSSAAQPTSAAGPLRDLTSDIIVVNSDSNSSLPERPADHQSANVSPQEPKKRGRKKGSKNHKSLLDEAESSFTNKLAVSASRGNSKVKTTQELLANIQKNSVLSSLILGKPKEDLEEKAAKLTERVSEIDQKLNTNASRNKGLHKATKITLSTNRNANERVIESGSVINDKSLLKRFKQEQEDEDVNVEEIDAESSVEANSETAESQEIDPNIPRSLSIEDALAQLLPIDKSVLLESDDEPRCTCQLIENKSDFSIDEEEVENKPKFEITEDPLCPAKPHFREKYLLDDVSEEKVHRLHKVDLPGMNGNCSIGTSRPESTVIDGLYVNIVPNIYEHLDKDVKYFDSENFKKYNVSESDASTTVDILERDGNTSGKALGTNGNNSDNVIKSEIKEEEEGRTEERSKCFREWYECVDTPSYNDEVLRILPYCIVD